MTIEQFTYWLNGFFEISQASELTSEQVQIIKDHLDLCFNKQTPDRTFLNAPKHTIDDSLNIKLCNDGDRQNDLYCSNATFTLGDKTSIYKPTFAKKSSISKDI